jgi:hypothetical protein
LLTQVKEKNWRKGTLAASNIQETLVRKTNNGFPLER